MQSKNGTMIRELANFDRLSRELQQEKLAAKAASARELRKEKAALERQTANLQERMGSLQTVEYAKTRLEGENQHLATSLSKAEREVEKLQSKMNRIVDERNRVEEKYQRLVHREKELAAQLLRSGRGPGTSIQTALAPGGVNSVPFSGGAQQSYNGDETGVNTKAMRAVMAGLKNEVEVLEDANRSLQQVFVSVEQERDYFKHEASKASSGRLRLGSTSSNGSAGGSSSSRRLTDSMRSAEPKAQEIKRYQAESKQLSEVVKRLEFQLHDASSELAWLRVDHDKLRLLYQQKTSSGGRNALVQERQANTSTSKSFQQQHEHEHEHNQVLLRAALADRQGLEGTIARISNEAEQLRTNLAQSQHECAAAETKAGHLEALMLASMASGASSQQQQQQSHGGVGGDTVGGDNVVGGGGISGTPPSPAAVHAERAIAELTDELDAVRARCTAAESEVEKLRRALQSLHTDRDSLVAEADQQSVTVNQLEQQLHAKDADTVHGGAALHAAQEELARLQAQVHAQQQDAAHLQQRCAALTHERDEVRANAEGLDSAIQGAHLDLDNMTREHQAVHAEYHRALAERTATERELENANARNEAIEQMLEEKFDHINAEATMFQSHASAADREASGAIQQQLDVKSSEVDLLRRQLLEATATRLEADRLRDELKAKNTAQYIEITQLQARAARDGRTAGLTEAASMHVESSLQAAADDAVMVEQLSKLFAQNEQLQSELREKDAAMIEAQTRVMQSDKELESNQALELEDLLTESRTEHAKAAITAQKLTAENTALRRTVQDMTEKAGVLLREVHELREVKTRGDEVSNTLRRELANTRFESSLVARQAAAAAGTGAGAGTVAAARGGRGGGVGEVGGGEIGGGGRSSRSSERTDSPPSRGEPHT